MTAPRSSSSGGADGTQASQPETIVPRQPGPGLRDVSPAREAGAGPGSVEELVAQRRLASLGRKAWLVVLAAAVGVVAVGILLLAWPSATLTIVAILLGVSLLVSGLLRLFDGFTARDESGGVRAPYIVIGLPAVPVGPFCLPHPGVTIFLPALLVASYLVMPGGAGLAPAPPAPPPP